MKIYIVQKGSYSDRHVVAVCTTKERAQKLAQIHSDSFSNAYYEEWNTDVFESTVYKALYHVWFYIWAGNQEIRCDNLDTTIYDYADGYNDGDDDWYVFAEDQEHAIKKAQDLRAEVFARRSGIT